MSKKEIEEALEKVMDKNYHEKKNNHEKISIPNDNNNKTKSEEINNYNEDISNYNQETSKVETKKNEQYESKVSELNQKIDDLTETLKRVQADFINYKNRVEKEKAYCIEYGNAELIKKLLPVLDSFDLALQNATDLEK
ncbi:MAG: nucleotide exchange factor GrpE, partial [Candidatus Woesearchaeota archaeon]